MSDSVFSKKTKLQEIPLLVSSDCVIIRMSILRAPALLTILLLSLAIPQALPCLCSILKNFKVMDWMWWLSLA